MSRQSGRRRHRSQTARSANARPSGTGGSNRWIWVTSSVALAAVVAIALAVSSEPPDGTPTLRDPAAVAAGAELFAANCAVYHGTDMRGSDTGPPLLNVIYAPNHHADEAFQRAVAGGVQAHHWNFGTMAPIPGLNRDDVALIIEYARSEQEAAGIFRDPSH